ncbi:MAG: polysaccharide pyruvyl transferase family protein [Cyanobacteriota bacterium]|nr:polysaccharide pyruvyl transferase family protein [Cyanobacteriota bacterium]
MKLFYYKRPDGVENFGDRLNTWLWPQLLPNYFDDDETTRFIGFGTLLNNALPRRIPKAKKAIVFSTGVGYEKPLTVIPGSWKIHCVRGPLSAQMLGLPQELAVADGAILARRLFQPTAKKSTSFSFMPHIERAIQAGETWQKICEEIGFSYIDPRWSVERVLSAIDQTEVLLAEAMHGAIVADTLRVPWIPIVTSPKILEFKWRDWCYSVKLKYRPNYLASRLDSYPRYARGVRSSLRSFRHWGNSLQQNGLQSLNVFQSAPSQSLAGQLLRVAKTARPQLSSEERIEQLTVELESRLSTIAQSCHQ